MIDDVCKTCGMCCQGELSGNGLCSWLTPIGCMLPLEEKSVGCDSYPFVFVEDKNFKKSRRVLIDTACPHAETFLRRKTELTGKEPVSIIVEIDKDAVKHKEWAKMIRSVYER